FYRMAGFDLSQVSDRHKSEWQENADWLKLSFHSDRENSFPYQNSPYDEVFQDCRAVHNEILRFASAASLAETTTVHYCQTTLDGTKALYDNGVKGLLGLFGSHEKPSTSYSLNDAMASEIRSGKTLTRDGIAYAAIDMIINTIKLDAITPTLIPLLSRETLRVMIHEQYFYPDYKAYQPDFEEKLITVFSLLAKNNFESKLFEEMI
ncbi:MAG: hypothetical protein J6S34_05235, partial [Clostridia bacterium]|nr:hypothetical protein [Clostridia bacterium]